MAAFTIFLIVTGVAAPVIGSLLDRYGARAIIAVGAFIGGVGFLSLNFMHYLWQFYVGYIVIGIGLTALGQVPATAVVSNWFEKRRGTAIGITSTGVGAGVLALAPIIGGCFIPNFGWRASYLFLGLFVWILIPLSLLILKTKPSQMGLYPDEVQSTDITAKTHDSLSVPVGLNLKMSLSTSAFWLISLAFLINGYGALGVFQNQVPYLLDAGFPLQTAVLSLTSHGTGSTIGKFFFGWLCDRIQAKYANAISLILLGIGTIILMFIKAEAPLSILLLYAIILGFGAGGWLPTMSMLVNINFGLKYYGTVFGTIILVNHIGGAIGPLLIGYMYDVMNNYYWAFLIVLALYVIAIPAVLAVRRPNHLAIDKA